MCIISRFIALILGNLLLVTSIQAQQISGMSTQWSDSFAAWDIYATEPIDSTNEEFDEVKIGELKQRWANVREDWTEWDFDINDRKGTIKMKWKNDPSQWELRTYDGSIVTMKTIWAGDFTQWRITGSDLTLDFRCRYTNDFGQWEVMGSSHGTYKVNVVYSNDPRDWEVSDALDEKADVTMKLAMMFIATYHSSPKE